MGKKKRKIKKLKQKIKQLEAQLEIQQKQLDAYTSKDKKISKPNHFSTQNRDRQQALLLDNQCSGKFGDRSDD